MRGFPWNSQLITCKSYILFNAISICVPKVRNYGYFRQHVIPTVITCLLRGTPCDTGFSYTFYRGNICSVCRTCNEINVSKCKNLNNLFRTCSNLEICTNAIVSLQSLETLKTGPTFTVKTSVAFSTSDQKNLVLKTIF